MNLDKSSEVDQAQAEAEQLNRAIPKRAPIKRTPFVANAQELADGLLKHDFFNNPYAKQDLEDEWERRALEDEQNEDPLAGDVEPTGGYEEVEFVDVRDLETNEDTAGNWVDGHGNLLYPEDER